MHYSVVHAARFSRIQLATRIVAFCALGMLGLSFTALFAFLYLALPAAASARLAARREPVDYVEVDGPRVLVALHWFAAASAWAGLICEYLPGRSPTETIELEVEYQSRPTAGSALWRVITGLPSAFVLVLLGWIGAFVWIWAAFSVLFTQRVGEHAFNYLVGLQRWSIRLLVYQASLVDEYPPFSFADTPPHGLPAVSYPS